MRIADEVMQRAQQVEIGNRREAESMASRSRERKLPQLQLECRRRRHGSRSCADNTRGRRPHRQFHLELGCFFPQVRPNPHLRDPHTLLGLDAMVEPTGVAVLESHLPGMRRGEGEVGDRLR